MQVRIVNLDGIVSDDIYEKESDEVDAKGLVQLLDKEGNAVLVHQKRIAPLDARNKAFVEQKGDKLLGFCPQCSYSTELDNGKFSCPDHGVFDTIGDTSIKPIRSKGKKPSHRKNKEQSVSENEQAKPAKKAPVTIDLAEVKKYGELWTKDKIKFDHATVDVKSHTLIQTDPLRKLCFNTYNGVLGKKSRNPLEELRLEEFAKNENDGNGKPVGYHVKGELKSLQKKLEDSGYEKQ